LLAVICYLFRLASRRSPSRTARPFRHGNRPGRWNALVTEAPVVRFGAMLDMLWIDPDDPADSDDFKVILSMVVRRTAEAAARAEGQESVHPVPRHLRLVEPD
jgi:hypothetical protein